MSERHAREEDTVSRPSERNRQIKSRGWRERGEEGRLGGEVEGGGGREAGVDSYGRTTRWPLPTRISHGKGRRRIPRGIKGLGSIVARTFPVHSLDSGRGTSRPGGSNRRRQQRRQKQQRAAADGPKERTDGRTGP